MHIETIDPAHNDVDLAAMVSCVGRGCQEHYGEFPVPGAQRLRYWESDGYGNTAPAFGAFDDAPGREGELLGVTNTSFSALENLDLVECLITVPPNSANDDAAGAKVVEGLLAHILEFSREQGRSKLAIGVVDALPVERYAAIRAGQLIYTGVRSVLDLQAVDREQFAAWAEPSAANEAYRLVRWVDRCPDEWAEAYMEALVAMDDAPMEEWEIEHPKWELKRLRGEEDHGIAHGVHKHVTAAVTQDGQIGGFTIFAGYPQEPGALDIWDTGVARAHRGHGLGMRLKSDATLWMLREYPDARWVHTYNNQENEHMLAVNRRLGYRAADRMQIFEFLINPDGAA